MAFTIFDSEKQNLKGNYFCVIWVIGNKPYLSAFYFEIWNFNFWLMALLKLTSRSLRCKGVPVLYIKFSVPCFEFLELKWSLHLFKMPNMAWYLDKVVNNEVIIQWRDTAVVSYNGFFFPLFVRSPPGFGQLWMYAIML